MTEARRPGVVVDTMVVSWLFGDRPDALALRYRDLIGVAPVVLAFQTIMEIRYGALRAGWGELRRRRLERRLAELVVAQPRRRDDHHLRRASPGVPADRACPRWQGAWRGSMDRRHRNPPRIAARLRGPRLSRSPPARAPDRRARNLAGGAYVPPSGWPTKPSRWPFRIRDASAALAASGHVHRHASAVLHRVSGGHAAGRWR